MPQINRLPENLINQIAAGEVIERPSSVVKELLDNSLDAGATQIDITLRAAGRELIHISDNGSGIPAEEAPLALERHATSKIASFDDLIAVSTLGFRGEALPSIASISYFTLTTRTSHSDTALRLKVEGGKHLPPENVAAPLGTAISVEHLFYNVPARRKFLKSDSTELGHTIAIVKAAALAHLSVGFTLREGKRQLLRLPAGQTLRERVASLTGESTDNLLEVMAYEGHSQLQGIVSPISDRRPSRDQLYFFVNSRPVDSRIFNLALREAYGATLGKGHYPSAYLFLTVPPAEVDVNVHPAKREVRFRKENEKLSFMVKAIGMSLASQASPIPSASPFQLTHTSNGLPSLASPPPPITYPSPVFSSAPFPAPRAALSSPPPEMQQAELKVAEPIPSSRHGWQFISFLHSAWALYSTPEGLAIVAIAAAQQRIAYERVSAQLAQQPTAQTLLIPALLQLTHAQADTLERHLPLLTSQGFHLSPFGTDTYRLEAIPTWANSEGGLGIPPEALLLRELAILAEEHELTRDTQALQRAIATMAAREACVPLAHAQAARHLIDQLLICQQPLKAIDGSPTLWLITRQELQKKLP
jgi:DNA mismatch repair protein MutL